MESQNIYRYFDPGLFYFEVTKGTNPSLPKDYFTATLSDGRKIVALDQDVSGTEGLTRLEVPEYEPSQPDKGESFYIEEMDEESLEETAEPTVDTTENIEESPEVVEETGGEQTDNSLGEDINLDDSWTSAEWDR